MKTPNEADAAAFLKDLFRPRPAGKTPDDERREWREWLFRVSPEYADLLTPERRVTVDHMPTISVDIM